MLAAIIRIVKNGGEDIMQWSGSYLSHDASMTLTRIFPRHLGDGQTKVALAVAVRLARASLR